MRTVFADTWYWVALVHRQDQWHEDALILSEHLKPLHIITVEEVLVETVSFFSGSGGDFRYQVVKFIERIMFDPNIEVIPQSHQSFLAGLQLYEKRLDKAYSLTDCIAMQTMKALKLSDVLTYDHHFQQEGFNMLMLNTAK